MGKKHASQYANFGSLPKYVFFIDEFPMTGSGKIQKFKLKDVGLQLCKEQGIEII